MKSEKRRVQRVLLDPPIDAILTKNPVRVIDLSTTGARVEHSGPLGGRRIVELRFVANGRELSVACELVRSRLQRSAIDGNTVVYSSGLRFTDPAEEARAEIRALVASTVAGRRSDKGAGGSEVPVHAALSLAV